LPTLSQIRNYCLSLPRSEEVAPFGDPIWSVNGNWFAIYGSWQGRILLSVRVEPKMKDVFLKDSRFVVTPYLGRHSWVSLIIGESSKWDEVRSMIDSSYHIAREHKPRKPSRSTLPPGQEG
jgi:predicted DNA-binding protein (MmcQ/YjbR family)